MKKLILAFSLAFMLAGCTDAENATRILTDAGYKDIQITGYSWFACSEDDFQHTGFIATGATGKQVTGAVCSGIFFKDSTIRFR